MPELFSDDWAEAYRDAWNSDDDITSILRNAEFSSVVAFGFPDDEDHPSFVMTIDNGVVASTDKKPQEVIEWDIRATKDNWISLIAKPPGLMKLGIAYTSRQIRFKKGDYATMIKDPSLAGAFVRSFVLMGKVV
jgi:hypothetical protein